MEAGLENVKRTEHDQYSDPRFENLNVPYGETVPLVGLWFPFSVSGGSGIGLDLGRL